MTIETKYLGGHLTKAHEENRNGVKVGIIEGYLATWDLDRGDGWGVKDQFVKGAFIDSINDHKQRNRQIRFKDHHGRTVGGFPINEVFEDAKGLFVKGEINLEVQQGQEAYALAKQGVLADFSIGFSIEKSMMDEQEEIRTITKAVIWEGSIVDEPMNPAANITAVKSMADFADLPIAEKGTEWDMNDAGDRVSKFIDESSEYRMLLKAKAFINVAVESGTPILNTLIADVINGELVAIPKAVNSVANFVKGVEGKGKGDYIYHLERYFAKMHIESPFTGNDKKYHTLDDAKDFDVRTLERSLIKTGAYSKKAAKYIVSMTKFDKSQEIDQNLNIDNKQDILNELVSLKKLISK